MLEATFPFRGRGNAELMIGVGIALIVLGVVFLFIAPWVGIVAGALGLVLAFFWIGGFGRSAVARDERTGSGRA